MEGIGTLRCERSSAGHQFEIARGVDLNEMFAPFDKRQSRPQSKRIAGMDRLAEPYRADRSDHALLGARHGIRLLKQRRHKGQEELARHDRPRRGQRLRCACDIGMDPVAVARQRDEAVDRILRHGKPSPRRELPADEGGKLDRLGDAQRRGEDRRCIPVL